MRMLSLLLVLLFSFSAFSAEQSKTWIYGGFDFGLGSQKSDDSNEDDTTDGRYYGAQIMGQYRFDAVDFEAGLGWMNYKVSTDFDAGVNSRVRLRTEVPYIHTGAFYKFTERFSVGLVGNFMLDGGVLIAAKDKSTIFAGIGAYYNIPLTEKMDFRIGALAQKSMDFLDRDVTMIGMNLQLGMPIGSAPKPVLKPTQTMKVQNVIVTKKVITLVTFDETLINFETDSYILSQRSKALLADLAAFLASNNDIWESLNIHGHTDLVGSDDYNNVLSVRRANSVYEELTKIAVNKKKLSFDGSGKQQPLDTSVNEEAFAKNRRVDLQFVNVSNKAHLNAFITKLKEKYQR